MVINHLSESWDDPPSTPHMPPPSGKKTALCREVEEKCPSLSSNPRSKD